MGFLLSDAPRKPLGTADESKLTRAETGAKIKQLQHALRRLPSLRAKMQESGDLFDQLVHHPEVSLPSAFLAESARQKRLEQFRAVDDLEASIKAQITRLDHRFNLRTT